MRIGLLDCTLRDGGFLNDWHFGELNAKTIVKCLIDIGVEAVELGFLNASTEFNADRQLFSSFEDCDSLFGQITKQKTKFFVMHNVNDSSEPIELKSPNTCVDGVRIIFKKGHCKKAIEVGNAYKTQGFLVCFQFVATIDYDIYELERDLTLINQEAPYCVSIVDTYGQMFPQNVRQLVNTFDKHLNSGIKIGFHGHNNLQLAFANSIEFCNSVPDSREVIVDVTLNGFGKGAGNTPSELFTNYINSLYGSKVIYDQALVFELLEFFTNTLSPKLKYGYSTLHSVAASANCHPNYVKSLVERHTITMEEIYHVLSKIPENAKLYYNQDLVNELYDTSDCRKLETTSFRNQIAEITKNKNVILVAPGPSSKAFSPELYRISDKVDNVIISINFYFENADFIFFANQARASQFDALFTGEQGYGVICTSNINFKKVQPHIIVPSSSKNKHNPYSNSLVLFLELLCDLGIHSVFVVGADGFTGSADYIEGVKEPIKSTEYLRKFNDHTSKTLKTLSDVMDIKMVYGDR